MLIDEVGKHYIIINYTKRINRDKTTIKNVNVLRVVKKNLETDC